MMAFKKPLIDESVLLELWNERAAIREFDGEQPRPHADFLAMLAIKREYGWFPAQLERVIQEVYNEHLRNIKSDK